jgi:hypothetical protein
MDEVVKSKGWRRVGRHYLLLLWKNFILAKRMPIRTVLEITLPVFFGFLLLAIRHIVKADPAIHNTTYQAYAFDQIPPFKVVGPQPSYVAYAPQNNFTTTVMQHALRNFRPYIYSKLTEN